MMMHTGSRQIELIYWIELNDKQLELKLNIADKLTTKRFELVNRFAYLSSLINYHEYLNNQSKETD